MNIQNYHNRNKTKLKQRKENKMDYLKIDEKVKFLDQLGFSGRPNYLLLLAHTALIQKTYLTNSDKSQRATTEQVLDPRTLLILQKMLQRQLLKEIHGCISTGKEANVYHAITDSGDHRAIKGTVQK